MLERIKQFISLFAQGMIHGEMMNAQGGGIYINGLLK